MRNRRAAQPVASIDPRTTSTIKEVLTAKSTTQLELILQAPQSSGKSKNASRWRTITVRRHTKLVLEYVTYVHQVTRYVHGDGSVTFERSHKTLRGEHGLVRDVTLPKRTDLHACSGSSVLGYVSNYASEGRLGQLTFFDDGQAVFVPYGASV